MSISANFPNVKSSLLLDFANSQQLDPRVTFSRSTTAPYYDGKTSVLAEQNLLIRSQEFNQVGWNWGSDTIVSGETATAPDGTTTADSLVSGSTSAVHFINQPAVANANGQTYSVYAKANTLSILQLTVAATNVFANFDLSAGTVGTVGDLSTATITSVGSGWYRCVLSTTSNIASSMYIGVVSSTSAARLATSSTAGSIYLWGAQLEQRSSVTAYNATTTSALTNYIPQLLTAPINSPRFDFNPTTGESLGLLIEQSSTNLLTYSQDFSNAVWTKTNTTVTTGANIAPDGTQTANKLVESTSTSGHNVSALITVISATSYTSSIYAKASERGYILMFDNNLSVGKYFNLISGTILGNYGAGPTSATITSVGNGWYRCTITITTTSTNLTGVNVYISTDGSSISYTGNGYSGVYIWQSQFEALAFATSPITTTSAQVTRASDNASMTGTNFSSWYNQGQGTWLATAKTNSSVATGRAIVTYASISRLANYVHSTNGIASYDGTNVPVTANTITVGTLFKSATNYQANTGMNVCLNGGSVVNSAYNNNFASATFLGIGSDGSSGTPLNGTIAKIAYYPIALTNSQLQSLTGS
jgi:hypothetical protein